MLSQTRDMHERCNGKLDTHTVLLLVENCGTIQFQLPIELCDCPTSCSSAHAHHVFVTLVCTDKLRVSRIRDTGPQKVNSPLF